MGLGDYRVLSFDCYGTLIDWEAGITGHFEPWLADRSVAIGRGEILGAFADAEAVEEAADPAATYPQLLRRVHGVLADRWGLEIDNEAAERFGDSVGAWPAFADAPGSLRALQKSYRLVVLSNVDRGSFAGSEAQLGLRFDAVHTAEDIGSYKPDPSNFRFLLDAEGRAGFRPADILHVGQSLYHDHVPARTVGLATCWIQRPSPAGRYGATLPPAVAIQADFHFESLRQMAAAVAAG